MNKKAQELSLKTIIVAILAILVLLLLVLILSGVSSSFIEKLKGIIEGLISFKLWKKELL